MTTGPSLRPRPPSDGSSTTSTTPSGALPFGLPAPGRVRGRLLPFRPGADCAPWSGKMGSVQVVAYPVTALKERGFISGEYDETGMLRLPRFVGSSVRHPMLPFVSSHMLLGAANGSQEF